MFPLTDSPPQLEEVAKKIVKQCKGLALSIVVIGGLLLKSPRTVGYWENVLNGLRTNDSTQKQEGLDALFLSYNHLPPHLKPCFLYMGTFKEDSRISASNITRLWVAEGFIKPMGGRVLENIAEDHLKELSDRNLVLGLERRFTGKIKSFCIHDLLRDLCIKVGEQKEFFYVWKPDQRPSRTMRRLVGEHRYMHESGTTLARSILVWIYTLEYVRHKLLRVFDATSNGQMPGDIYGINVNLRYLVHKRFSTSVCLFWNLQTLTINDIFMSPALVMAPLEIWKMRQLRHFKCRMVFLPDPPPGRYEQDRLEQLQTLKRAVNLRLSEEMCEMIPNIKNLNLRYDPKMPGYDDSLIECLPNLDRFHKLESLNISSKLPCRDPELNAMLAFPLSLKKLCLESRELSCKDMSVIGSLPQLQLLRLKWRGKLWSPVGGQFLCLKFLEMDSCDLSSWDADNSHFPVLEKLFLRALYSLKEIPLEIGEIPTLALIRVHFCSESVAISAVKIKKDQLKNYDNDTLQIEIKVLDHEVERFKKTMEEEELALDLFKLDTL